MNLQFISDSAGKTTGVFIPINEWNDLKIKFKGIELEEAVPDWHLAIVRERLIDYEKNPKQVLDFEVAMNNIERDL